MCGIVGVLNASGRGPGASIPLVDDLAQCLHHRGPDDAGSWADSEAGIALGHRRLSILDLSSAGHQPMLSGSARYVIAFNGEIYNHMQIRKALDSSPSRLAWRGHSDTETLLAGFDHWGVERTLEKVQGMFAFALWDREKRELTLARDRIGEKPLYYGWQHDTFLFGSELKALRRHPSFHAEVDRYVLERYLHRGFVEAPYSIYRGIYKLPPGTCLRLSASDRSGTLPEPRAFWCLREVAERGYNDPFRGDEEAAAEVLEAELARSVSQQMVADVPVGAFLSGGVDSSTVVALMQAQSSRPVKTFTIGFTEAGYEEAQDAKRIAQHLGTVHTELYVTSREALQVIPRLPTVYDEPFGDSSAVPTFIVAQLARESVTVALSGDGGDELFGGYTRYQRTSDVWRAMERIPYFMRRVASYGLRAYSRAASASSAGWKAGRIASYLAARTGFECYQVQLAERRHGVVLNVGAPRSAPGAQTDAKLPAGTLYDAMMYHDTKVYLPDDILVKVDRASMAVSLETRIPMLDARVIELAWRMPLHVKVRNGEGKWILKQVLKKYVPASLTERPKKGFGIPLGEWIRGPLRDWAEDLLSEKRLKQDGFLDHQLIRNQWSRHLAGTSKESDALWQVLMFQAWLASTHPASTVEPCGCGR